MAPPEPLESDTTLNNDLESAIEIPERVELPPEVLRLVFEYVGRVGRKLPLIDLISPL
jgi:hypothetical protein